MGIETSSDHGGADCGFTSAIIVIEGGSTLSPAAYTRELP